MLKRLIYMSIRNRPGRALLVIGALVMGIALEAALINLSLQVGAKSSEELRAYGANVLLLPKNESAGPEDQATLYPGEFIPEEQLAALDDSGPDLAGYAPLLYGLANVNGTATAMTATWLESAHEISPWWQIDGELPARGDRQGAVVGKELAARLGLAPGASFRADVGGQTRDLTLKGIISTGASEDNQILVDLALGQELVGQAGKVSAVQVSVPAEVNSADEAARILEEKMPAVRAKTLQQVVQAEAGILAKIELLMLLVTSLILIVSGLTVSAALTNAVSERRRDIGLMRSLGAEGKRIARIIIGEIALLGIAAGLAGWLLGIAAAQVIGLSVFGTTIPPSVIVLPVVIISSVALALISGLAPLRQALAIEPAVALRGE